MLDELVASNQARKDTITVEVAELREKNDQTLQLLQQSQAQVSHLEQVNEKLKST